MFFLTGNPATGLTLKSYKATTANGKSTVVITCETEDHYTLGGALRDLDDVAAKQKQAAVEAAAARKVAERAAKRPKSKSPMLALPAPYRALSKPEDTA